MKVLVENIGRKISDIPHSNIFTDMSLTARDIKDSMDAPGECDAKLNKPVSERQIPHNLTYIWHLMNKMNTKNII